MKNYQDPLHQEGGGGTLLGGLRWCRCCLLIDLIGLAMDFIYYLSHVLFFVFFLFLVIFVFFWIFSIFHFGLSINALRFIVKHINAVTRRPPRATSLARPLRHCTSAAAPAPAPWQRCQIIACVADEAELRVNFNPIVCSQKSAAHKCKQPTHTHTLAHTRLCVFIFAYSFSSWMHLIVIFIELHAHRKPPPPFAHPHHRPRPPLRRPRPACHSASIPNQRAHVAMFISLQPPNLYCAFIVLHLMYKGEITTTATATSTNKNKHVCSCSVWDNRHYVQLIYKDCWSAGLYRNLHIEMANFQNSLMFYIFQFRD